MRTALGCCWDWISDWQSNRLPLWGVSSREIWHNMTLCWHCDQKERIMKGHGKKQRRKFVERHESGMVLREELIVSTYANRLQLSYSLGMMHAQWYFCIAVVSINLCRCFKSSWSGRKKPLTTLILLLLFFLSTYANTLQSGHRLGMMHAQWSLCLAMVSINLCRCCMSSWLGSKKPLTTLTLLLLFVHTRLSCTWMSLAGSCKKASSSTWCTWRKSRFASVVCCLLVGDRFLFMHSFGLCWVCWCR